MAENIKEGGSGAERREETMRCSNCGAENDNMAVFCGSCGSKLEPSAANAQSAGQARNFCSSCGAEIQDGSRFCERCGAPTSANGMQGTGFAGRRYMPRRSTAGSEFGKKLKTALVNAFKDPEGYIKAAAADESYFPVTMLFLGVGSFISGLAVWLYVWSAVNSLYSAFGTGSYAPSVGWWFGTFVGVFALFFLQMICAYFLSIPFGGKGSFRCWIGEMAPTAIFSTAAFAIAIICMTLGTFGGILALIVCFGGGAIGSILLWKALETTRGLESPKTVYAFASAEAALGAIISIAYAVVLKSILSGISTF